MGAFLCIWIKFAMPYARSGAHNLNLAMFYYRSISHAIFVFQRSFERYGYDFHIGMGMCPKAHARSYNVIVEYSEYSKAHALRVIIISKTKAVMRVEPAMISISASVAFMENCLNHKRRKVDDISLYSMTDEVFCNKK